jgi:uncharacterized phage protein gp47/JayE
VIKLLFTKSYDEIYKESYKELVENTPITNFGKSSTTRNIVEITARRLSDLYNVIDAVFNNTQLITASGEALDRIGMSFGVTRGGSTRAYSGESNFKFFIAPITGYTVSDLLSIVNSTGSNLTEIVINAGTSITINGGSKGFTTVRDVVLTNDGVYVPIISTGEGSSFNVGQGSLTVHNIKSNQLELSSISDFIDCINEEAIDTARDYESDDNYRARIFDSRYSNANGNEIAVRNAALSVPGVSNAIINRFDEGIGSFNVVVLSTYPITSTAVLNAVHEAVSQVVGIGNKFTVSSPEYVAIKLKIKLYYTPKTSPEQQSIIRRNVRKSIIDYTNNLSVGGQWYVNEAIERIMSTSNSIRDFEQLSFRSYNYQYQITVGEGGRTKTLSQVNQFQNNSGINMIWTNQRCNSANPPQKFVMLADHLIVC